jgi:7,8-dihydropterin-6-yl-methyl-4-(beta-D-ribofuranosyl)aminobenzene 5'-phosphate synthase
MLTRRMIMALGGAGVVTAAVPGVAATPALAVPSVDRLTLQIVTDSGTFGPFLDPRTLPGLSITYAGNGGGNGPRMLPRALLGEFGLSILGTSERAGVKRTVMVDFGYSAPVLANNLGLLGIDANSIDAAVLSHGHLDHYGGFAGLSAAGRQATKRIPLIVGGEETFCERIALIGTPPPVMGTLDRGALSQAGFDVRVESEPQIVADHAFTSGVIPLKSFERAAIPTQMHPGVGCDRKLIDPAKRDAALVPDDAEHELATCYAVKGLGLVVIASCSHRGVLNSVRRAQAVSGIERIHAVIGGFHLVKPRTEDEARRTVAEFARIDPKYIIPMHCTGEVFIAEALRLMPQKVVRSYVGSKFAFAA